MHYNLGCALGDKDGNEEPLNLPAGIKPLVPWHHDETIYYAHDRRESQWVFADASPAPYAKGEGPSIMDADLMSPDYGFCRSPDGTETARVIFKPGKDRDRYFDNSNILAQATRAMDIYEKYYSDDDHLFIFDNATTHAKRADNALSARKMPKNTPKEGTNWGIEGSTSWALNKHAACATARQVTSSYVWSVSGISPILVRSTAFQRCWSGTVC